PLCDERFHNRSEREWLHVHVEQEGDSTYCIFRVQRAENEVARHGRSYSRCPPFRYRELRRCAHTGFGHTPFLPVLFTLARATPRWAAIRRARAPLFTRVSSAVLLFRAGFSAVLLFSAGFSAVFFPFAASSSFAFFSAFDCFCTFFGLSACFCGSFFASSFFDFVSASSFSPSASGFSSFSSFPFSPSFGASPSSPSMNAILSPTFTLPPSSP